MKKRPLFAALFFLLVFSNQSALALDTYKIDPTHASATWKVSHFGFSQPSGKFSNIEGVIEIDEKNPQSSSVQVVIKSDSLVTGLTKFDEHLKSGDFFNVNTFPKIEFKSSAFSPSGKVGGKLRGNLTILGVSKMVTLDVKLNKVGTNPINQKKTVGFSATTTIKRSDFGMKFGLPGIADKVEIEIELEATLISSTDSSQKSSSTEVGEWKIIPSKSSLGFTANQDKSSFSGAFKKFSGKLLFDKNQLNKSSIEIDIDTTSVELSFIEAQETIKGSEWLATNAFPKAKFKSSRIFAISGANAFEAEGSLTLKGKSVPIKLNFTLPEYSATSARAEGTATIKRSAFGVGNRDVKKANGVLDDVLINFVIAAEK